MTYVTSDIHGDSRRFHEMLKNIEFSSGDMLYVLGDVIDRGSDGIALLLEIMNTPNMVMLLGNHEHLMLQVIETGSSLHYLSWMNNGGGQTVEQYLNLSSKDRSSLRSWLRKQPCCLEIEVQGREYLLVHGFPGPDQESCVWGRPNSVEDRAEWIDEGKRVIIGHTPVLLLHAETEEEQDTYVHKLIHQDEHLRILHAPGFINLDCGCGHDLPVSRCACLRLDDMKEFYT